MIELGLERISKLVKAGSIPWRAIHVAGTNGKGSVCSYASAILAASNIRCGRFTSPHLIDRWDCISVNDSVIDERLFRRTEAAIRQRDRFAGIGASEFELLTATAFEVFSQERIEVAVIEVGLGGRHDATNVLRNPLATVITKIGLDHEALLGKTLEAITYHKAGIMKLGSPCIADGTNTPGVIEVLREQARVINASRLTLVPQDVSVAESAPLQGIARDETLEEHQLTNLLLAYEATKVALEQLGSHINPACLVDVMKTTWPGRLQFVDFAPIDGPRRPILLDGAHNVSSADILASYVNRKLRQGGQPVTWVLGFSKGKATEAMLKSLMQPGDHLVATQFGPVQSMPWVEACAPTTIIENSQRAGLPLGGRETAGSVREAMTPASSLAGDGQVVIAGSLYLVSDALRELRDAPVKS